MPGRFTVYVEAASNPPVEADLPFAPMNLGERADGRPSDYVLTTMDVCAFNQNSVRLSDGLGNRHLADEGTQG